MPYIMLLERPDSEEVLMFKDGVFYRQSSDGELQQMEINERFRQRILYYQNW